MTVAQGIGVFLIAVPAVILLAIRLDRYEDELERRFRLRTQGARGGDAEYDGADAGPNNCTPREPERGARSYSHS